MGRGRNNLTFVLLVGTLSAGMRRSGVRFWNAVVAVSSATGEPALATKNAEDLGRQDAAGGAGLGQLVGTEETTKAGLQISASPVCLQRMLAPFSAFHPLKANLAGVTLWPVLTVGAPQ